MKVVHEALIANGASQSGIIDLHGLTLVGLVLPAAWTAADITFLATADEEKLQGDTDTRTFVQATDDNGAELTATVVASAYVAIPPAWFKGAQAIKLRSGTAALAVNQAADRTIKAVLAGVEV